MIKELLHLLHLSEEDRLKAQENINDVYMELRVIEAELQELINACNESLQIDRTVVAKKN